MRNGKGKVYKEMSIKFALKGIIHTITDGVLEKGVVLIGEGGRILDVGLEDSINIPENVEMLDFSGKHVTPGLIDAHAHIGLVTDGFGYYDSDINETSNPITPDVQALDGINFTDPGLRQAFEAGVTIAGIPPGSANPISGLVVAIRTGGVSSINEQILRNPVGLKQALGENPKRAHGKERKSAPKSRLGIAALIRKAYMDALNYREQLRYHQQKNSDENRNTKPFNRKNDLDVLVRVLNREFPVRNHAHRVDDIMTAIRLSREFGYELVIDHCTEGHLIASELKNAGVKVVLGPLMRARVKFEIRNRSYESARILWENGVPFALMSDHPVTPLWHLNLYAGLIRKAGVPAEDALKSITLIPAEILRIAEDFGSIEKDKIADLVVWSHHPLGLEAEPETILINGNIMYSSL